MKFKFKAHNTDKGLKKILKDKGHLGINKIQAKAGVIGSKAGSKRKGGAIDNVTLAVIHEFGSPAARIPERSFIRSTFEKHKARYNTELRLLLTRALAKGTSLTDVFSLLGLRMASDMKKAIADGIRPPNSERTLERKKKKSYVGAAFGTPKPLIDTGQLVSSITWEVVDGRATMTKDTAKRGRK